VVADPGFSVATATGRVVPSPHCPVPSVLVEPLLGIGSVGDSEAALCGRAEHSLVPGLEAGVGWEPGFWHLDEGRAASRRRASRHPVDDGVSGRCGTRSRHIRGASFNEGKTPARRGNTYKQVLRRGRLFAGTVAHAVRRVDGLGWWSVRGVEEWISRYRSRAWAVDRQTRGRREVTKRVIG
jgi:hypothetical protein